MGDLVTIGVWQIVIYGIVDPYFTRSGFMEPEPGTRWVAVDVEVFNTGDEPDIISSLNFELRDASNRTYSSITTDGPVAAPNGEVEPGGGLRGTLVFEVLADSAGFRLHFQGDISSVGSAIIQLQ